MRITKLEVQNFKSLVDFQLPLAKFTCLIGLNGSGKSTVLQFVEFLAHLVRERVYLYLSEKSWHLDQIPSKTLTNQTGIIKFRLEFELDATTKRNGTWGGEYSLQEENFTFERLTVPDQWLAKEFDRVRLTIIPSNRTTDWEIPVALHGSMLFQLRDSVLNHEQRAIKRFMEKVYSFGLLNPGALRASTRDDTWPTSGNGYGLAGLIHSMPTAIRARVVSSLRAVYPRLDDIKTYRSERDVVRLSMVEDHSGFPVEVDAPHINDGLLRLCAIFAELEVSDSLILLDEIENGLNPEVVEAVVRSMIQAPGQTLVTTHSPMILNYLTDDQARESVVYLYKTSAGETKAIRFFEIPSLAEKLKVMGPGEAFVDTNLTELQDEIEEFTRSQ